MKSPAAPLFDFSATESLRNRRPLTHVVILIWEDAQRVGGQWLHNGQAGSSFFFLLLLSRTMNISVFVR